MKVVNLRPSPNEEARILKEERERRRKLRIQQVLFCICNYLCTRYFICLNKQKKEGPVRAPGLYKN